MQPLRVRLVAHDAGPGGAGRALARLADALAAERDALNLDPSLRTVAGPDHVLGGPSPYPGGVARVRRYVSSRRRRLLLDRLPWTPATSELHSRADVWTGLGAELNRTGTDVVNLHWVGTGTLSIEEIGRLRHPVVMTLHDMWAFCGAEHVTYDERFREGYPRGTRPSSESGIDWNRRVWRRKLRSWTRPMSIVTPSTWLADRVRESALMGDWPVTVIPNPLDTEFWRPGDKAAARSALGLPLAPQLVLFGADGGTTHRLKGGDLLEAALRRLPGRPDANSGGQEVELMVYGGPERWKESVGRLPYAVHHLGRIDDDRQLRDVYAAADLMVVPSRIDNLPNTAVEAQACGRAVAAFNVGGLPDIVVDGVTGRLAPAEDVDGLAAAIAWILKDSDRRKELGAAGRERAVLRNSPSHVAAAYSRAFREAAGRS